jgi:hypothetical protein
MSKNTIDALRDELFATLRALRNKDEPMDIERARAVSAIAQTIINTAKVEVDHLRVTGSDAGSRFLGAPEAAPPKGANDSQTVVERPGVRTVTHRIQG